MGRVPGHAGRLPLRQGPALGVAPDPPLPIAYESYVREVAGVALGLVDGSANRFHTRDLVPPYPFGDGREHGSYLPIGIFGLHTVNGWLGRDVR